MATIVPVGEEPRPIDFPIVDHTVFFFVHFCQLFCAEKKLWGNKSRGSTTHNLFWNGFQLSKIIGGTYCPRRVWTWTDHSGQKEILLPWRQRSCHTFYTRTCPADREQFNGFTIIETLPVLMGDFVSRQGCLSSPEKVSNHLGPQPHTRSSVPQDTKKHELQFHLDLRWYITMGTPGSKWLLAAHPLSAISLHTHHRSKSPFDKISCPQSMDKMLIIGIWFPNRHLLGKQFCIVYFLVVSCKWCSWCWLVWPVITWCLQMSKDSSVALMFRFCRLCDPALPPQLGFLPL